MTSGSTKHPATDFEGWTLDPTYKRFLAQGGDGCIIFRSEEGALPLKRYFRLMHIDDATKWSFPHEKAEFEPQENMFVCERPPREPVYLGGLTDGYQHVGVFGTYLRAILAAS